jgi:hypothetical protein
VLVPPTTLAEIIAIPRVLGFQLHVEIDDEERTEIQPGICFPFKKKRTLPSEVRVA